MNTDGPKTPPLPPELMVRPVEACAMLSISRSSLYNLISRGEIEFVRVGRSLRIPVAAVHKLAGKESVNGLSRQDVPWSVLVEAIDELKAAIDLLNEQLAALERK